MAKSLTSTDQQGGALKELIVAKNPNAFAGIDHRHLVLYNLIVADDTSHLCRHQVLCNLVSDTQISGTFANYTEALPHPPAAKWCTCPYLQHY